MALSMGVARQGNSWHTYMMEQEQLIEQYTFENTAQTTSYLAHTCARYPELTLAVSLGGDSPFLTLSDSTPRQQEEFIEHFAETYQVYLFPSDEVDAPGFEGALGAAVLAGGLFLPGKDREIVDQLSIREAVYEPGVSEDEFKTTA